MKHTKLNVGLLINGGPDHLTTAEVANACITLFDPLSLQLIVKHSATEPTAVVTIWSDVAPTEAMITLLCTMLRQDAIAGRHMAEGFLYGPKADAWGGAFNPEFFLE